ncbi:GTP-binding protein [Halomonas sp. 707D7]|uniref:CobW family GTP-binding protein n=1 Tax=Halomonas sp. 707D7 TaxID=1681044 RepID=UPI00209E6DE5|nr:CobW family GTP-binding protein [Halomonas sp. 707D7]MCP1312812.1 CobW family GTP-binding protein [Halomonas sp. 707D7]
MAPTRIPTHVVTGFLGSGKTTLIHSLIAQKPVGETWAILVNEFGQIGIDQAMFEERGDVVVKGLPGGCLCCQLAFVLQAGLVNLIARARPDRLIIEPSGLGHPAGLLDLLRGDAFREALEVRDIVVALDPRRLDEPKVREHETFNDQLAVADAVVLTQLEHVSSDQRARAHAFLEARWPRPKWVHEAEHRTLPLALLEEGGEAPFKALERPDAHRRLVAPPSLEGGFFDPAPRPGAPRCETASSLGYTSTGLRWHPDDRFDLDLLAQLLSTLPKAARAKGVFHTHDGWKRLNRAEGALSVEASTWRQDSRLEILLPDAQASADGHAALLERLRPRA